MANQEWVVRIIADNTGMNLHPDATLLLFMEQLNYAGIANSIKEDSNGYITHRLVFDLYAPRGVQSKAWAELNSERMRSFGINAAAAPKWKEV